MNLIEKEPGLFVCQTTFNERHTPRKAGFTFLGEERYWWTRDPAIAAQLSEFAGDPELKAKLEAVADERNAIIDSSRAVSADITVPVPEGLRLFPFQLAGIKFAIERQNVLIGDEMGLGKTLQSIGVINLDESIRRVLVICPASLRLNWRREMMKWLVRDMSIGIAVSRFWPHGMPEIVIVNYDILTKHREAIDSIPWDLLIIDECHKLKNPSAKRTQTVYGKWHADSRKEIKPIQARRKILLTGTPIVNRPIELWPHLKILDPARWRSKAHYVRRYCDGHEKGASNLFELQEILRSSVLVRRLKKDVLPDLPAKIRQVIEFPADGAAAKILEDEKNRVDDIRERISSLQLAAEKAKASADLEDYKNAMTQLRQGRFVAFEELSRVRHETAVAKIPYVIDHVRLVLESEPKVVVFIHHKDVAASLMAEFGDIAVSVTGDTNPHDRMERIDRFQADKGIKLFVGSIQAAGVGITLTAARHEIFAELDWVPGNISQAEDRCHRIGQANSVLIQHLVMEGSLDARLAETIILKQAVIDSALDGEHNASLGAIQVSMAEILAGEIESPPAGMVEPVQSENDRVAEEIGESQAARFGFDVLFEES